MKNNIFLKIIIGVIVFGIVLGLNLTGCLSTANVNFIPGVYETASQGYRGLIKLRVYISDGGIEDIEILTNSEDRHAVEAMEELRDLALEMNSADLDAISGATITSRAFLAALEEALVWAAE